MKRTTRKHDLNDHNIDKLRNTCTHSHLDLPKSILLVPAKMSALMEECSIWPTWFVQCRFGSSFHLSVDPCFESIVSWITRIVDLSKEWTWESLLEGYLPCLNTGVCVSCFWV